LGIEVRRAEVDRGNVAVIDEFRELGKRLLDQHVLFGIVSDEDEHEALRAFFYPRRVVRLSDLEYLSTKEFQSQSSRFDAPTTVRVSASWPAKRGELDIHFVNYNRTEPPKNADGTPSTGRGIMDEKPIEAPAIACDFYLHRPFKATGIECITPESPDPQPITFTQSDQRIRFTLPKFLVYSIARIKLVESEP
jgi:hypothetical protein